MDAKIQELLLDYGLEGYGLYFYCLEMIIADVSDENISFELEHDHRIIARNTGSTPKRVSEILERFLQLGLFGKSVNGNYNCLKILNRLDSSMTSNKSMRKLLTSAKLKHTSRVGGEKTNSESTKSAERVGKSAERVGNELETSRNVNNNFSQSHDQYSNSHDFVPNSHDESENSHARREETRLEETKKRTRTAPTIEEIRDYASESNLKLDCSLFYSHYEGSGWINKNNKPVINWKNTMRSWASSRRNKIKNNVAKFPEFREANNV